ncbi:hypothetical protein ACLIA0_07925 [Bacillaceae bacterium W0354]
MSFTTIISLFLIGLILLVGGFIFKRKWLTILSVPLLVITGWQIAILLVTGV